MNSEEEIRKRENLIVKARMLAATDEERLHRLLERDSVGSFAANLYGLQLKSAEESRSAARQRKFFNRLYYILGIPAAVLAAVAGATALSSAANRLTVAIIALSAAALSASVTFLDSAQQREKWAAREGAWDALNSEVTHMLLVLETDQYGNLGQVAQIVKKLTERASDINADRDRSVIVGHTQAGERE